jgi:hypothetical protein
MLFGALLLLPRAPAAARGSKDERPSSKNLDDHPGVTAHPSAGQVPSPTPRVVESRLGARAGLSRSLSFAVHKETMYSTPYVTAY